MSRRHATAPSVVLFGYLGGRNLGDDAMLAGLLAAAAPGARFTILARDVTAVSWPSGLQVDVLPARVGSALKAMLSADAVIRVGGTSFHDEYADGGGRMLIKYIQLAMLFVFPRLLGKRVAALGVGAGSMTRRSTRFLARLALSACHRVVVRDEASAAIYRSLLGGEAIISGVDLAFLMDGPGPVTAGNGVLAVSVLDLAPFRRGEPEEQFAAWTRLITAAAKACGARQLRLLAFKDNDAESDLPLAARLAERLRDDFEGIEIISSGTGLTTMWEAIANSDVVVATRYHSAILAAAAGRPMAVVPYNAKLSHFCDDLGLPEQAVMDLGTLAAVQGGDFVFALADTTTADFAARKAATRAAVVSMTSWEPSNG